MAMQCFENQKILAVRAVAMASQLIMDGAQA